MQISHRPLQTAIVQHPLLTDRQLLESSNRRQLTFAASGRQARRRMRDRQPNRDPATAGYHVP